MTLIHTISNIEVFFYRKIESEVAQLCLTLCNPMDYSLPGSSVCGIFQAIVLSGLPFPSPEDLPDPGIKPGSPALQVNSLLSEPPGKSWIFFLLEYPIKMSE